MSRRTVRWQGAIAATVVLAVVGIVDRNPTVLLAGVVPLAYVGYGTVASTSVPPELEVERSVEPSPAPPGRPVDVSLTLSNPTERTLGDVRVVDEVPPDLAVTAGTPRAVTTLRPGDDIELTYRRRRPGHRGAGRRRRRRRCLPAGGRRPTVERRGRRVRGPARDRPPGTGRRVSLDPGVPPR
jgi:uncharacterized protein (DUF58 family)